MATFAQRALDGDRSAHPPRSRGTARGPIAETLQRRSSVQAIFQLQQALDAGTRFTAQVMSATEVVQRATEKQLNDVHGEYVEIVKALKGADDARALEPLLARLYDLVCHVSEDTDHETRRDAYSGIYDYVARRLIDRVWSMAGGRALVDKYLSPILEILRNASQVARGEKQDYTDTLRTVDPDGSRLDRVLAQAAYMSGDMFGVSAALALDPKLGVAIFYDQRWNREREIQDKLFEFYSTKEGDHPRVALIPVGNSQLAYKKAVAGDFSDRRIFPGGAPKILSNVWHASTIGNATRIVADAYRDAPTARAIVESAWLPEGAKEGTAKGKSEMSIAQWCEANGITKGPSYAFIWYRRSGAKGGAHKELDTSAVATSQIIRIARTGLAADKIVLIGDSGYDGETRPDIDLTDFWNRPDTPFHGSGRKMQLALFAYLAKQNFNVMNVGMRSGALEGPALLGIRTVFLEEKYNLQEGRMDKWQDRVPGFERVELEHVPTREGKEELARLIDLTEQSNRDDYEYAVASLAGLLKESAPTVKVAVSTAALEGIYVEKGIYNPVSVDEALPHAVQLLGGNVPKKIWPAVRVQLHAAIRAFQEWQKARVKRTLVTRYKENKGPEEGLSKEDEGKLWGVIARNVGGWRESGSKSGKGKTTKW